MTHIGEEQEKGEIVLTLSHQELGAGLSSTSTLTFIEEASFISAL